jgi:hypothetical protein
MTMVRRTDNTIKDHCRELKKEEIMLQYKNSQESYAKGYDDEMNGTTTVLDCNKHEASSYATGVIAALESKL